MENDLFERTLQHYKECCEYSNLVFEQPDFNLSSVEETDRNITVTLANCKGDFYKRIYRKKVKQSIRGAYYLPFF